MQPSTDRQYADRYRSGGILIEARLASLTHGCEPKAVYEPIRYILTSGGKRVRAMLVLLASEAVGGTARRALNAGAAVEMLHTFTLVHDDVMDHAALRRGKPTIHMKWDENVAILAGDELIALAYRALLADGDRYPDSVVRVFTDALVQVCEGQGLDKEFESRPRVGLSEYFTMIEKKTARMISAGAEIGGLVGRGTARQIRALKLFGRHLGIAFQIQDDLLDISGDGKTLGKRIGGDIVEGKKTFLLLRALERATGGDLRLLKSVKPGALQSRSAIERVRQLYLRTGVFDDARSAIRLHTKIAARSLASIPDGRGKSMLLWLSARLLGRTS